MNVHFSCLPVLTLRGMREHVSCMKHCTVCCPRSGMRSLSFCLGLAGLLEVALWLTFWSGAALLLQPFVLHRFPSTVLIVLLCCCVSFASVCSSAASNATRSALCHRVPGPRHFRSPAPGHPSAQLDLRAPRKCRAVCALDFV